MPKFEYESISQYSVDQIYDLILDVERYPEFLPWCSAAMVIEGERHDFIADLVIHYKAFNEHYRSRVLGVTNEKIYIRDSYAFCGISFNYRSKFVQPCFEQRITFVE